jgi:poly(3-hydroxybutyrate) depolymerase
MGARWAACAAGCFLACSGTSATLDRDAGTDAGSMDAGPEDGPDDAGPDAGEDAGPPSPYGQGCSSQQDATGLVLRKGKTAGPKGGLHEYYTYVPRSYDPSSVIPLVVSLHGAGDNAQNFVSFWEKDADEKGFMVLVPEASAEVIAPTRTTPAGYTWESTDTVVVDGAIADIQRCYNTDLRHQIIHGFSAGGELAYILGLSSLSFSGLAISSSDLGSAEVVAGRRLLPSAWLIPASIFHGEQDPNFPFAKCGEGSRDALVDAGHTVYFHPFVGGHMTSAADWLQMYGDLESSTTP